MTYYGMMNGVPDYHKSTDTPDVMDPAVLRINYKTLFAFTERLVNAGIRDTVCLADCVLDYEKEMARKLCDPAAEISTGKASPVFARKNARKRLDSILSLVEPDRKEECQALLQPYYEKISALYDFEDPLKRPVLTEEQKNLLSAVKPVKNFHGTLSFDNFMYHKEEYPKIGKFINGWNVPEWIDYSLMWADGSRSAADIWNLLTASGNFIEADDFINVLEFLKDKKFVRV